MVARLKRQQSARPRGGGRKPRRRLGLKSRRSWAKAAAARKKTRHEIRPGTTFRVQTAPWCMELLLEIKKTQASQLALYPNSNSI
jgi:hypothetical protein